MISSWEVGLIQIPNPSPPLQSKSYHLPVLPERSAAPQDSSQECEWRKACTRMGTKSHTFEIFWGCSKNDKPSCMGWEQLEGWNDFDWSWPVVSLKEADLGFRSRRCPSREDMPPHSISQIVTKPSTIHCQSLWDEALWSGSLDNAACRAAAWASPTSPPTSWGARLGPVHLGNPHTKRNGQLGIWIPNMNNLGFLAWHLRMWTSALLRDPSRLGRAEKAPVHHKDLFLNDCEERQKQKELLKSLIDTLAQEGKGLCTILYDMIMF